jgi:N-methylhydantoinase A
MSAIALAQMDAACVSQFVHGSTVVINALTERKGAKTALLTTRGFRDVLAIARASRPDIYNLRFQKQEPFIPRALRLEVDERLDFRGNIVTPLDRQQVRRLAEELLASGVEAIAVCFLHSYANDVHEKTCGQILAEVLPDAAITLSSSITKEWREYERTNTAVLNAFVQPVASRYLANLEASLRSSGVQGKLQVMKSNGGTNTFELAKEQPIHLVESGPVGGVIGARTIGEAAGTKRLITIDVGGTTAKTSLIDDGEVRFTTDYHIEKNAFRPGYPVKVPVVDIVGIGAGGGSIAWIDDAGSLKIGPHSAGAVPGPACYGKGGNQPTVTDANLILNRIDSSYFLGGQMEVDVGLSREAFRPLAESFAVSVEEAALGVVRLADASMVDAIKLVSVRRGYDPREFALIAFGGGGPMHAAALAQELQVERVIVPATPGTFSALGMLMTEPMQDFVRTRVLPNTPEAIGQVAAIFEEMREEAGEYLARAGYSGGQVVCGLQVGMRYVGQEHTVRVPVTSLARERLSESFHELHERVYTFRLDSPTEFVDFHVTGRVAREPLDLSGFAPEPDGEVREKGRRPVYFGDGWHDAAIFARATLSAGQLLPGPCIIEEPSATTVVPPGMAAQLDRLGNIILTAGN